MLRFKPLAEAAHVVLVAPKHERPNYDAIENFFDDLEGGKASAKVLWPAPRFGDDSAQLDAALRDVFAATRVDPRYVAILGFSHGGSYALSLGTANPQLFRSIAALSPGVLIFDAERRGTQRIFLAHGRKDDVQPFARTSRNFVNKLTELGYDVTFLPYDGGHDTPGAVTDAALRHIFAKTR
jgi:predicted esterase